MTTRQIIDEIDKGEKKCRLSKNSIRRMVWDTLISKADAGYKIERTHWSLDDGAVAKETTEIVELADVEKILNKHDNFVTDWI